MPSTLYEDCVKAGVKVEGRYSDLYIPVNEITTPLVEKHIKDGGARPETFKSNIPPHDLWYDVPFAYTPYWVEKEKENDKRREQEKQWEAERAKPE